MKTLTDANTAVTTYTYDARNRETLKSYSASADGLASIATGYDGNGSVTSTTETYAGGITRAHARAYDDFNRLQRETDPWGDAVTHTYDAQGNRTGTTAQGSTTLYSYDELNRRVAVTAVGGPVVTTYDRTNLPTGVSYPNGIVTTTTYDAAMRVKSIATARAAATLESFAYLYDKNGNRTQQTRLAGAVNEVTTYGYDNDDWLTSTTVTSSDGTTSSTQAVTYTLDAVGNRSVESSTATGTNAAAKTYTKNYTFDPRDNITQVAVSGGATPGTTTYAYDNDGNLTAKNGPSVSRTFVWSIRDRLIEVKDAQNTIARYKYNAEGLRDEVEGERRTTWVEGFAYLDKAPDNSFLAKYETQANGRSPAIEVTAGGSEYLHEDALGSSTLETDSTGRRRPPRPTTRTATRSPRAARPASSATPAMRRTAPPASSTSRRATSTPSWAGSSARIRSRGSRRIR